MRTIAVLHSKGGTGKSTLSIHLARALQLLDETPRVLLLDTDVDQLTSATWSGVQDERISLPVLSSGKTMRKELAALAGSFEYCVIDGAAKLERLDAEAISVADVVLIPVQPSVLDLWPLAGLVSLIQQRQAISGGQPAAAFVVSRDQGIRESRELEAAVEEMGLPLLGARLPERVVYRRAIAEGRTALDAPAAGESASEATARASAAAAVLALRDEALALLSIPTP